MTNSININQELAQFNNIETLTLIRIYYQQLCAIDATLPPLFFIDRGALVDFFCKTVKEVYFNQTKEINYFLIKSYIN